jgi:magnesium-transporting ATPase (P-type)
MRYEVEAVQANSAWYITLILCQFWHIWCCKTRQVSIFKHRGMIENRITIYGVCIALAIMLMCVYIPWLQDNVFYCANPPAVAAYIPHLGFMVFVLSYTETTKWYARNNPNAWFTRHFMW